MSPPCCFLIICCLVFNLNQRHNDYSKVTFTVICWKAKLMIPSNYIPEILFQSLYLGEHSTPTHPTQPSTLSSSISLSQGRHGAGPSSRRQSCRMSYGGPGHSTYLPPPQFADGQSSECSDSNFSMVSGGAGITIATLPRRFVLPWKLLKPDPSIY